MQRLVYRFEEITAAERLRSCLLGVSGAAAAASAVCQWQAEPLCAVCGAYLDHPGTPMASIKHRYIVTLDCRRAASQIQPDTLLLQQQQQQHKYSQIHTDTARYTRIQNTIVFEASSASQIRDTQRNQAYREKISGLLYLTDTLVFRHAEFVYRGSFYHSCTKRFV
jgi:hypothetical protein